MFAPKAIASEAWSQIRRTARAMPSGPSATGQVIGTVCERNTEESTPRSDSSSTLRRMGCGMTSWWACSALSASRLRSEPTAVRMDMTTSSRIGSIGGLVTWAKSCLK